METQIKTSAVTEAELATFESEFETCFVFAAAYAESRDDAVMVSTEVDGTGHCYVYDRELDVTIDATCGQFRGLPSAGAWDGNSHPHVSDDAEIEEFESRAAFEEAHINIGVEELPTI